MGFAASFWELLGHSLGVCFQGSTLLLDITSTSLDIIRTGCWPFARLREVSHGLLKSQEIGEQLCLLLNIVRSSAFLPGAHTACPRGDAEKTSQVLGQVVSHDD